jgi:2-polyprenyl-3-methyl-5-hydroxy-6-metoxy-1,4-benzoquinol methylase
MDQENIIESVKNIYNEIGKEFSATRQYIWPDLKPFLEQIEPGSSILDIGCGNGRLLMGLTENINYTGLDISEELLKKAKEAHPEHRFIKADITKVAAWKGLSQYDYVYSIGVFHHLPTKKDQTFVLNQIEKHLKPKGKVLITVWNLWQPKYRKFHLDLKTKIQNIHHVYIPFQGKPRFCFAFTKPYLKRLINPYKNKLELKKTKHNYLIFTP